MAQNISANSAYTPEEAFSAAHEDMLDWLEELGVDRKIAETSVLSYADAAKNTVRSLINFIPDTITLHSKVANGHYLTRAITYQLDDQPIDFKTVQGSPGELVSVHKTQKYSRDDIAAAIYATVREIVWLSTFDGTPNVASYAAADDVLAIISNNGMTRDLIAEALAENSYNNTYNVRTWEQITSEERAILVTLRLDDADVITELLLN